MNRDDEPLLSAYIDGELDAAARRQVEAQRVADPALTDRLRQLATIHDLVAGLSRPSLPRDLSRPVVAAIGQRSAASSPLLEQRRRPRLHTFVEIAAAAIIVVGLTLGVPLALRNVPPRPDRPPFARAPRLPSGDPAHRFVATPAPERLAAEPTQTQPPLLSRSPRTTSPVLHALHREEADVSAERERGRIRELLDSPRLRRVLIVTDVIGGRATDRVDSLVKGMPRVEPSYGRITVSQGIVIDPSRPDQATVFALVMDDRELKQFQAKLDREFPDAVEATSADPAVVTQLADVGQVSVLRGTPALSAGSMVAELLPPVERPLTSIVVEPGDKPIVKTPLPDEFEGMAIREVREPGPLHPGQEVPTPEQERSGPHPSTRVSSESTPPPAVSGRDAARDGPVAGRREAGAPGWTERRHAATVLVWVTTRGRDPAGRR